MKEEWADMIGQAMEERKPLTFSVYDDQGLQEKTGYVHHVNMETGKIIAKDLAEQPLIMVIQDIADVRTE